MNFFRIRLTPMGMITITAISIFTIVFIGLGVRYETSDDPAMILINQRMLAGQVAPEPRLIFQSTYLRLSITNGTQYTQFSAGMHYSSLVL